PEPRSRDPIPTTEGPTEVATAATASWSSLSTDMGGGSSRCWGAGLGDRRGNLQIAIYYRASPPASPSPTMQPMTARSPSTTPPEPAAAASSALGIALDRVGDRWSLLI